MELLNRIASIKFSDRVSNDFDIKEKHRELISLLHLEVQRYENLPLFFKQIEQVIALSADAKQLNIWYVVLPLIRDLNEILEVPVSNYFASTNSYLEKETKNSYKGTVKTFATAIRRRKVTDKLNPYELIREQPVSFQALGRVYETDIYVRLS